ncbi:MAG: right-handed parallel beta-helix repeat-containing protein [Planctomycetes bacterium]|nr:right-handed parallel beta-helix repeat-containing protein [Planctomycetota bacterium]
MAFAITPPFDIYQDASGNPLNNGYINIGAAGLNPETNPITPYWDLGDGTRVEAEQPVRTINGYPSLNGMPGRLYVEEGDYSILTRDKNSNLVYSSLHVLYTSVTLTSNTFEDTVATMVTNEALSDGDSVWIRGYTTAGDGGHAQYLISVTDDDGQNLQLTNGLYAIIQITGRANTRQFGPATDVGMQAAIDYMGDQGGGDLDVTGEHVFTAQVIPRDNVRLWGHAGAEVKTDSVVYYAIYEDGNGSADGFEVHKLAFTEQTPSFATGTAAIRLIDCDDVEVEGCKITGYTHYGISVHPSDGNTIQNPKIYGNTVTGIGQSGIVTAQCIVVGSPTAWAKSSGAYVVNNICNMPVGGRGAAMKLEWFKDSIVKGNIYERIEGSSSSGAVVLFTCSNITYEGNLIDDSATTTGLTIHNTTDSLISSNRVTKSDVTKNSITALASMLTPTSITRSGTTATVTTPTEHYLSTGEYGYTEGANESQFNGHFVITKLTNFTYTYEMSSDPGGSATGTITVSTALVNVAVHDNHFNGTFKVENEENALIEFSFTSNKKLNHMIIASEYMVDVDISDNKLTGVLQLTGQDGVSTDVIVKNNISKGYGTTGGWLCYPDNVELIGNRIANRSGANKTALILVRGDDVRLYNNRYIVGDGATYILNQGSSTGIFDRDNVVVGSFTSKYIHNDTNVVEVETTALPDGQTWWDMADDVIYVTANTGATTVNNLARGKSGETRVIIFGDANTTMDFTGTTLKGNAGVDWSPAVGDSMTVTFDGTNWYCDISKNV